LYFDKRNGSITGSFETAFFRLIPGMKIFIFRQRHLDFVVYIRIAFVLIGIAQIFLSITEIKL